MKKMSLARVLGSLASLARTGWMLRGVPPAIAETVAEHAFASAVIAGELCWRARRRGLEVDVGRCIAMAVYHDMAESIIGDITRRADLGSEKRRVEERAYMELPLSPEAKELYLEFEGSASLEARLARVAELLATYWRATLYRSHGYEVDDIMESAKREALSIARESGLLYEVQEVVAEVTWVDQS